MEDDDDTSWDLTMWVAAFAAVVVVAAMIYLSLRFVNTVFYPGANPQH